MGTTLAVMIGLLTPTADLTRPTNYKVYGDSQVANVGFTAPTARDRQTWAHAAGRQFSVLPAHYAQEGIPLPPRSGTLNGGDVADGSTVDGPYFEPLCEYDDCTASVEDCCNHGFGVCSCRGRLPNASRARCKLPQHHPYVAEPKTYYYLRAYTYIHTSALQEEAALHGALRTNPYDTKLFAGVYEEIAKGLKASAAGVKP